MRVCRSLGIGVGWRIGRGGRMWRLFWLHTYEMEDLGFVPYAFQDELHRKGDPDGFCAGVIQDSFALSDDPHAVDCTRTNGIYQALPDLARTFSSRARPWSSFRTRSHNSIRVTDIGSHLAYFHRIPEGAHLVHIHVG